MLQFSSPFPFFFVSHLHCSVAKDCDSPKIQYKIQILHSDEWQILYHGSTLPIQVNRKFESRVNFAVTSVFIPHTLRGR